MLLSGADVQAVQFSTTRMRVGYDMAEVDAFLDHAEVTINELTRQLEAAREGEAVLRTQSEQLQARVAHLEANREFTGDPAAVMKIAQATADELISAARAQAASGA